MPKVEVEISTVNLDKTKNELRSLREAILGVESAEAKTNVTRSTTQAKLNAQETALIRQIKAINTARQNMIDFNIAAQKLNAPATVINAATASFNRFANAMTQGRLQTLDFTKVQLAFNNSLKDAQREMNGIADIQKRMQQALKTTGNANIGAAFANMMPVDPKAAQEAFNKVGSSMRTYFLNVEKGKDITGGAARATVGFKEQLQELTKSVQLALGPLSGIASRITAFTALTSGAGIRIAAFIAVLIGAGGLYVAAHKAADAVDDMRKAAERTGFAVQTFQGLRFAGTQAGVSFDDLNSALQTFNRVIGQAQDGVTSAQRPFQNLQISMSELRNSTPEEVFFKVADALKDYQGSASGAAVAGELFGTSQIRLIQLMTQGSGVIKQYIQDAIRMGAVLDDKLVDAATRFSDKLDRLGTVIRVNTQRALIQLIPTLENLANVIGSLVPKLAEHIDALAVAVSTLFGILVGGSFGPTGAAIGGMLFGGLALGVTHIDTTIKALTKLKDLLGGDLSDQINKVQLKMDDLQEKISKEKADPDFVNMIALRHQEQELNTLQAQAEKLQATLDKAGNKGTIDKIIEVLKSFRVKDTGPLPGPAKPPPSVVPQPLDNAIKEASNNLLDLRLNLIKTQQGFTFVQPEVAKLIVQLDLMKQTLGENRNQMLVGITSNEQLGQVLDANADKIIQLNDALRINAEIQAKAELINQTRTAYEQYAITINNLNHLLQVGRINQELYNRGLTAAKMALIEADPLLSTVSSTMDNMTQGFFDAATGAKTMAESIKSTIKSMVDDILKTLYQLAITNPIKNALFGLSGANAFPTAAGSVLSALIRKGSLFGSPAANTTEEVGLSTSELFQQPIQSSSSSFLSNIGSFFGGNASGGSYDVKGAGGTDSQFVSFMATPGENVTVTPPGGRSKSNGGDTYYIDARGADDAGLSRLESMIRSVNGSIEHRAVNAVTNARRRDPGLFGQKVK